MLSRLNNATLVKTSFGLKNLYRSLSSDNATFSVNKKDSYGGLHIDSCHLQSNVNIEDLIEEHVRQHNDLRTVWIKLQTQHYGWLQRLSKFGFKVHHSRDEVLVLFKNLQETNRVPKYAFTNIGVGAVVVNSNGQILFVKEKHPFKRQMWKFPGGYAEQGEDIHLVAEREVLEETGIVATFESILLIRHIHKFAFDCADMYFVCLLKAHNNDIQHCNKEIEFCEWAYIEDISAQLSAFNLLCLKQYLKYKVNPTSIVVSELPTPHLPIPKVTIYCPK